MPNKIAKLLAKIPAKDLARINEALVNIKSLDFQGLDVKRSKTQKNRYRVRVGRYRIVFDVVEKEVYLKAIDKRDEQTYRDF